YRREADRTRALARKVVNENRPRLPLLEMSAKPESARNDQSGTRTMRLTLRTLLAYLDDTLEPTQAKQIGQKVAESDTAQELIARIKQVTRRRRLTTPPPPGPGARLDATTTAESPDNPPDADQLAEVEQTCLASDVHLAEMAACHQILTLVLGEPALIPPTSKQRMY